MGLERLESRELFSFTVSGNSTAISDGDATPSQADYTDFIYMAVSSGAVTRTFTIQNTGGSTINFTGTPRVTITGTHASDFTVSALPAASIASGASTTFTITFNPSAAGTRVANVSIANNDPQGTFDFAIQGTGLVTTDSQNGLQVATIIPGVNPAAQDGQRLRVHYTGWLFNGTMFDTSRDTPDSPFLFTLGGGSVIDGWELGMQGLKVGEKRVLIMPSTLGYGASGSGSIPPNSPLIFEVELLAITGPNLVVTGNGTAITDGDTTPTHDDYTDLEVISTPGDSHTHSFVITNNAPGFLSFLNDPWVILSGTNANQFVLTQPVIDGGGTSATFTVKYQPNGVGTHTAVISIPTNDPDNPNFSFTIKGRFNQAPTVTTFAKSFNQDSILQFSGDDFLNKFTDPEGIDTLKKIKITSLPGTGTLKLNGTNVTVNQEIELNDLSDLTYTPAAGYFGSTSFTWAAYDGYNYSASDAGVNLNILSTDATKPLAYLLARDPDPTGTTFQFQIKFTDNVALNATTFSIPNVVLVTGPGGFGAGATLVSVNVPGNGATRIATYQVTAPGGTWNTPDAGRYNVILAANVIADTTGNKHVGGLIGRFYYSPDPLFSERYYDTNYADIDAALNGGSITSGYAHFMAKGQYEGRNPSAFFDEAFYRKTYSDVNTAVINGTFISGFAHFRATGAAAGRQPSLLFDQAYYRLKNADVATAITNGTYGSALEHFMRVGQYENRAPSIYFDPTYYLNTYSDVANAINNGVFVSALEHFVRYGLNEKRSPVDVFNETYYLANNGDVATAVTNGVFRSGYEHFIRAGQYGNRRPSLAFDPAYYLATYPDVAAWVNSTRSAYYHYLAFGRAEGRLPKAP